MDLTKGFRFYSHFQCVHTFMLNALVKRYPVS